MPTVALPVRVFAALGARVMVATNAAGGVNAQFNVGDVMVIRDHISFPGLAGVNPFVGANPPAAGGGDALGPIGLGGVGGGVGVGEGKRLVAAARRQPRKEAAGPPRTGTCW